MLDSGHNLVVPPVRAAPAYQSWRAHLRVARSAPASSVRYPMSSLGASYGSLLRSATLPRLLHACMSGMLGTLGACATPFCYTITTASQQKIITSGRNGLM